MTPATLSKLILSDIPRSTLISHTHYPQLERYKNTERLVAVIYNRTPTWLNPEHETKSELHVR